MQTTSTLTLKEFLQLPETKPASEYTVEDIFNWLNFIGIN